MVSAGEIRVSMTEATVASLFSIGAVLYVMRGVASSNQAGVPLVWQRADYSTDTTVIRQDAVEVFTGYAQSDRFPYRPGFRTATERGMTLSVGAGGVGKLTRDGPPSAVAVLNTTVTPLQCGLAGRGQDQDGPFCLFPLHGTNQIWLVPTDRIVLAMSTEQLSPSSPVPRSLGGRVSPFGPAIVLDLAIATVDLSFDVDRGWSSQDGSVAANAVPPGADLWPFLLQSNAAGVLG